MSPACQGTIVSLNVTDRRMVHIGKPMTLREMWARGISLRIHLTLNMTVGEIIFNLPNGLQAYYLSDASGGPDLIKHRLILFQTPEREILLSITGFHAWAATQKG